MDDTDGIEGTTAGNVELSNENSGESNSCDLDNEDDEFNASDWSSSIDEKGDEFEENQLDHELCEGDNRELEPKNPIIESPEIHEEQEVFDKSQSDQKIIIDKKIEEESKAIVNEDESVGHLEGDSGPASPKVQSSLSPELLQYLEENRDILTVEFLQQACNALLESRALDSGKDFKKYLEELKLAQSNFDTELERLRINEREAKIRYKLLKERHEKDLSSLKDIQIEHIFKNSGANDVLVGLKEKLRLKSEINANLKSDLETLRKQLKEAEHRCQEAELQCNKYIQAYREVKAEKEQLEMTRDKRLFVGQGMNLSAASSQIENSIPPIPPLNHIPSIDEIMKDQ